MKVYANKTLKLTSSATSRLVATYLAIIMLMSIGFSFVIYNISEHQLRRQAPNPSAIDERFELGFNSRLTPREIIKNYLTDRADEARNELVWNLVFLNIFVAIFGAGISYYLARKTLAPIEAAMASKDRFISDASHELRTPLTTLQTTNEVALRKPKLTIKQAKELIAENVEETKRLKFLTDGLLGLLKESQVKANMSEVSLQSVVSDAMNQVVVYAQEKDITVNDKVENIKLYSNSQSLVQILTILLENAVKYSPDKGEVTIHAKQQKRAVTISVIDNGIGIKSADMPHVFDRFYRSDNSRSRTKTHGYGLGLAIAKRLVHELDGEISVKSVATKGSTFSIKLPIKN